VIDLRQLLDRHEALVELATNTSFRAGALPAECTTPLDVLPAAWPFPSPVAVYACGRGGLWFSLEGHGVGGYASREKVDQAHVFRFCPYR
jgi:hypothetical protein